MKCRMRNREEKQGLRQKNAGWRAKGGEPEREECKVKKMFNFSVDVVEYLIILGDTFRVSRWRRRGSSTLGSF